MDYLILFIFGLDPDLGFKGIVDTITLSFCQVKPLTEFYLALAGSLVLNHTKTDLYQFTHTDI